MGKFKLIPKSEITSAEVDAMQKSIATALLRMGVDKKLGSEDELIVRDCLPAVDLAFATNAWVNQTAHPAAGAWVQDFSTRLAGVQQGRCIAFYKVFNRTLAPHIIASRFSLGTTSVLGVLQLEELYAEEIPEGYFGPVFWTDGETVRVEHYTDLAVLINAEQLGFGAMVCEKYGDQITEDSRKRITAARYVA